MRSKLLFLLLAAVLLAGCLGHNPMRQHRVVVVNQSGQVVYTAPVSRNGCHFENPYTQEACMEGMQEALEDFQRFERERQRQREEAARLHGRNKAWADRRQWDFW